MSAYFPFFIDIENKEILVVGGGKVALHKIEKLLPFKPKMTVVSKNIIDEIQSIPDLILLEKEYEDKDLESIDFAIIATDDDMLNLEISKKCKERKILANVVDDKEKCDFIFPSLIKEGKLTAAVSTSGASPQIAAELKSKLQDIIPDQMEDILDYLEAVRPIAKERINDSRLRARFLKEIGLKCFEKNRALSLEELNKLIYKYNNLEKDKEKQFGTVTLVGAGCGTYEDLTLRAVNEIKRAQVLIYDDLLDKRILEYITESCEKIYVGKRDGKHSKKQDEINDIILQKAKEGKNVVRLKGGDSFVFGRGAEEILSLKEKGIQTKVVPGITSAIALPELCGIPVTHRQMSRSFHVMTGHIAANGESELLSISNEIKAVANSDGTVVVLMGLHKLGYIASEFINYGKSKNTPVAVIRGYYDGTKQCVTGTLENIEQSVKEAQLESPAIIVIGETVGLNLFDLY